MIATNASSMMNVGQALQKALEAHRELLNAHLDIWKSVTQEPASKTILLVAQQCLQRTEQMLQQCSDVDFVNLANPTASLTTEESIQSLTSENKKKGKKRKQASAQDTDSAPVPSTSSVPQTIPVIQDPSGLFTIDSNPADLDVLLKEAEKREASLQKRVKRKYSKAAAAAAANTINQSLEVENLDIEPPSAKRKKTNHAEVLADPSSIVDNFDEGFEHRVALRLKEKDEEVMKKKDKKRKRESGASVEDSNNAVNGTSKKVRAGKRRKTQLAASEDADMSAASEKVDSTASLKVAEENNGTAGKNADSTEGSLKPKKPRKSRMKKAKKAD